MTDYSGHVDPGGPAISRSVAVGSTTVEVRKFSVGPLDNNVYLLTDTDSGQAVLVDAADEPDRILDEIADRQVAAIVTTQGHGDHWQALADVARATGAPTYLHPGDVDMVAHAADEAARDGLRLRFGTAEVELLHTPGHTPGSVCLLLARTHLLTGDTLFPGGPGRVTTPVEFEQIMQSLEQRLFTLADETWVYPGHGDDTTIGAERPSIPEWRARGW